jgi:hypothetical protein
VVVGTGFLESVLVGSVEGGLTIVGAEDLALLADAGAWFGHGLWLCLWLRYVGIDG